MALHKVDHQTHSKPPSGPAFSTSKPSSPTASHLVFKSADDRPFAPSNVPQSPRPFVAWMIRPIWPRVVNAVPGLARGTRSASTAAASAGAKRHRQRLSQKTGQAQAQAQQPWPLLKRRSNTTTESSHRRHETAQNPWTSRPQNDAPTDTNTTTTPALSRSHLMLTINGLSPNLKASDFARLSSTELSAWQHAIKKVQQQRHPDTYEPLGRYTVTFSTAEAAAAYQAKLLRLHALAQHRSSCRATGKGTPWQDSIPAELLEAESDTENKNTHGSLEEQVAQYTIALGTTPQQPLDVQRSRVTISKPWAPKLSALVEGDGYGEHPHLVMLDVSPPAASAEDLFEQICKDAETRGTRWGVARPHSLAPPPPPPPPATSSTNNDAKTNAPDEQGSEEAEDAEEETTPLPPRRKPPPQHNQFIQDVLRGRFIVSCSDEAEARRFHRFWNMRQLRTKAGHSGGRCVVRARMMEW